MIDLHAEMLRRLSSPMDFEWQGHGIGMLRTYLDEERTTRLNLWHSSLINPGISTMHTHPWPFKSFVMVGRLDNIRWDRVEASAALAQPYMEDKIACGPHFNGLKGEATTVWLQRQKPEKAMLGMTYAQAPEEIHTTEFLDGSATVIVRGPVVSEGHEASVFWPLGDQWGDATRTITEADIWTVVSSVIANIPQGTS